MQRSMEPRCSILYVECCVFQLGTLEHGIHITSHLSSLFNAKGDSCTKDNLAHIYFVSFCCKVVCALCPFLSVHIGLPELVVWFGLVLPFLSLLASFPSFLHIIFSERERSFNGKPLRCITPSTSEALEHENGIPFPLFQKFPMYFKYVFT
ncbi:unnamed protein product [Orchesella dallaii]|uniref:Uncharacterized protein n=1 Tax=Orchesella dallaii TaxID=48710 RepID=A0ABP1RXZ5_9HEXA